MDFAEEFARIDGGPSCMVLIIMVIIMVTVLIIIITMILVQCDIAWGIPSGRR